MKSTAIVLVLLALLALVPSTQCMAETAATPPGSSVATAAVPADVADFLATLSGGPSEAPGAEVLPPSFELRSTLCQSDDDCPTGELCCYPCGIEGCNYICMAPWKNGECPLFM